MHLFYLFHKLSQSPSEGLFKQTEWNLKDKDLKSEESAFFSLFLYSNSS